ncbi:hypothetical protein PMAYCL1PPCAC_32034 [Pristionchus mayeri]|uniref:Uncharacterized protein n=1 Tax=Pristionchus mayeri TaxID=1317129 RepID=A0AAN5DHD0_9BILA|nr:hypothetical protein PMAYCL1PPCAC_32027 [Pristionchus mayeri]GMR61839.1 hypothetical protein PMAYCL1PPCAC_32034 [Pristionchus mayeri]
MKSALSASPIVECAVVIDCNDRIAGWAGIASVGLEHKGMFKLAPVYCSSLVQFARLSEALLPHCESIFTNPSIIIGTLSGTVGARELEPLISNSQKMERITLFSTEVESKIRGDECFAPHNSCCHFDG